MHTFSLSNYEFKFLTRSATVRRFGQGPSYSPNCLEEHFDFKTSTSKMTWSRDVCDHLLADIFLLFSFEADSIQSLLSTGMKHLASRFKFTYKYIDDVLSISNLVTGCNPNDLDIWTDWCRFSNPEFENYLDQIYHVNLRSKTQQRATLLLLT